jgi:hypothetical protein
MTEIILLMRRQLMDLSVGVWTRTAAWKDIDLRAAAAASAAAPQLRLVDRLAILLRGGSIGQHARGPRLLKRIFSNGTFLHSTPDFGAIDKCEGTKGQSQTKAPLAHLKDHLVCLIGPAHCSQRVPQVIHVDQLSGTACPGFDDIWIRYPESAAAGPTRGQARSRTRTISSTYQHRGNKKLHREKGVRSEQILG